MPSLCFWHQYLICIFLIAIAKLDKGLFFAPVVFLVSFVLLSTDVSFGELQRNQYKFLLIFDQIGKSWSLGDSETIILQTTKANVFFVYSSHCINRLQSQQWKVCTEVWRTVFC